MERRDERGGTFSQCVGQCGCSSYYCAKSAREWSIIAACRRVGRRCGMFPNTTPFAIDNITLASKTCSQPILIQPYKLKRIVTLPIPGCALLGLLSAARVRQILQSSATSAARYFAKPRHTSPIIGSSAHGTTPSASHEIGIRSFTGSIPDDQEPGPVHGGLGVRHLTNTARAWPYTRVPAWARWRSNQSLDTPADIGL